MHRVTQRAPTPRDLFRRHLLYAAAGCVLCATVVVPVPALASVVPVVTEYHVPGKSPMPEDLVVGPGGHLWFTNEGATPSIGEATTAGSVVNLTQGANPGFFPFAIAQGANGNLWFTDDGTTAAIGQVTAAGAITEYPTGVGSTPEQLVAGPDSSMWFTDPGTRSIGSITASGALTKYTAGLNARSSPNQLAVGANGDVWFTDEGTPYAVGEIDSAGQVTEYATTGGRPGQIVLGPDGNLWFTEDSPAGIGMITPTGTIATYSAGLLPGSEPYAIISGPDDELWFTDQGATPAVGMITTSGHITEFDGLPASSSPAVMAFGPDGNLWFTDPGTHSIGRVTPAGAVSEYRAGSNPTAGPYVIEPSAAGPLWFTDPGDGAIGRVDVRSTTAPKVPSSPIPTTLTDSVNGSAHRFGQRLTYVAKASSPGSTPTGGSVTFFISGRKLCKASLGRASARCSSVLAPRAGLLTLTAKYGGSRTYRPSRAQTQMRILAAQTKTTSTRVVVTKAKTVYRLKVAVKSPGHGTAVGTVKVVTHGFLVCEGHLRVGEASCQGKHAVTTSFTAIYVPSSANFAPSKVKVELKR